MAWVTPTTRATGFKVTAAVWNQDVVDNPTANNTLVNEHSARHENGGADEISVTGLSGLLADGQTPVVHGAAYHTDVVRTKFVSVAGMTGNGTVGSHYGYNSRQFADATSNQYVRITFMVPSDFVAFTSLKAVWASTAASGNMYWDMDVNYSAVGELLDTHSESTGYGITATSGTNLMNVQEPATPLTLSSLAVGDYLTVFIDRAGADANDTLSATVHMFGILFTYTAHQ